VWWQEGGANVSDCLAQRATIDLISTNTGPMIVTNVRSEFARQFLTGLGEFTLVGNQIASGSWDPAYPLIKLTGPGRLTMIGNTFDDDATITSVDNDTTYANAFVAINNTNMYGAPFAHFANVVVLGRQGIQVFGKDFSGNDRYFQSNFGSLTGQIETNLPICLMSPGVSTIDLCIQRKLAGLMEVSDNNGTYKDVALRGLFLKEGTNQSSGTAVLVAGSKLVNTTRVTANSRIYLTVQTPGGTPGFLDTGTRTPGTSFTITSTNGADTSTVAWMIIEPAP
jgi:hypothetical protein